MKLNSIRKRAYFAFLPLLIVHTTSCDNKGGGGGGSNPADTSPQSSSPNASIANQQYGFLAAVKYDTLDPIVYLVSPDGQTYTALSARDANYVQTTGGIHGTSTQPGQPASFDIGTAANEDQLTPYTLKFSLLSKSSSDAPDASSILQDLSVVPLQAQSGVCSTAGQFKLNLSSVTPNEILITLPALQGFTLDTATPCTYQVYHKSFRLFSFDILYNYTYSDWLATPQTAGNQSAKKTAQVLQTTQATNALQLDLSQQSIQDLSALTGFIDLESLNLSHNQITSITTHTLDNLFYLNTLNLSSNQLSSLPKNLFDKNTNLENIDISSNQIASLPEEIFKNLPYLSTLNLASNTFTSLPEGIFDNLDTSTTINPAKESLSFYPNNRVAYSMLQTNLSTIRWFNNRTTRSYWMRYDGTKSEMLGTAYFNSLAHSPQKLANTAMQFTRWLDDNKNMAVTVSWQSDANWQLENQNQDFTFGADGFLMDSYIIPINNPSQFTNITGTPPRASNYNANLTYVSQSNKYIFEAMINGTLTPYIMDFDGSNKRSLVAADAAFAYGLSSSPDGQLIAYHENYQIYIAHSDGSQPIHVDTGNGFNFGPAWSADGKQIMFVSAPDGGNPDVYVANRDGSHVQKIGLRNNYNGQYYVYDVEVFHPGATDMPFWAPDSASVYYTAQVGNNIEIFQATRDGTVAVQMTRSPEGSRNYSPRPSFDGRYLMYGSKRQGLRQLYLLDLQTQQEDPVTNMPAGYAPILPNWQPPHGS